jgi:hypothetical protein
MKNNVINRYGPNRCGHGRQADDYRNQKIPWLMQEKLTQTDEVVLQPCTLTNADPLGCLGSSVLQVHILVLLDWPCRTSVKWKFHISRKRKLCFRQKTLFELPFLAPQKKTVYISLRQNSSPYFHFIFIFSWKSRKLSLNFHPWVDPSLAFCLFLLDRIGMLLWCGATNCINIDGVIDYLV